ncbi:lipopolysaccharide assembly protein LapA domain-containing protein [Phreatobacter sp.]|uniref:lipopolysaccharide assembly protein LapA domain-containing protein n=1 Tax=Phreatobacter sp. TaxID=1966341 RepID=UPI003F707A80
MLRRIVNWLVVLPIAIVAVALAVANRGSMTVSLDPFSREAPAYVLTMPIYVVILLTLTLGVVLGGVTVWWRQGRYRKRCRRAESDLHVARAEANRLRTELDRSAGLAASGGVPARISRPAA